MRNPLRTNKQRLRIAWYNDTRGRVYIQLVVKGIKEPVRDAVGKRYWLANFEEKISAKVRCGAVDIQPRVILKVFCPIPRALIRRNQREAQRAALKLGTSVLAI